MPIVLIVLPFSEEERVLDQSVALEVLLLYITKASLPFVS